MHCTRRKSPKGLHLQHELEYNVSATDKSTRQQDMRVIGDRIRRARELRGMSQTQLAKEIGTAPSQVSMVEANQSGTSLRTAMAAAKALNISMDYLVGWVDEATPTREIVFDLRTKIARIRELEEGQAEPLDGNWREQVGLTEIDAAAGADGKQISRRIKFPYPWLRKHNLRAIDCRIMRVVGKAMEPALPDGSAILIHVESTERRDGKIFVVQIGEERMVRRLVHDPETGWLLSSDNPDKAAWPTRRWPEGATVVGEVKWLGHTFT